MTTATFYGVQIDEPAEPLPASLDEMLEVFETLKPKASSVPLIRIGGDRDGSYLVPDDLDGISACFSPGVNKIKYFEDFLTDHYGISSHMCDFTCDVADFRTPMREGRQTFVKKWLDVTPGDDNISLADWISEHPSEGDLLLQMDIEGAEYRNVLATPDETLARFRVIVLEVHGLGRMRDPGVLRSAIAPFFAKLGRSFTSVHAHPNNCCGDFALPGSDVRIPNVIEVTFVRTDRFTPAAGVPLLPHPLDVSRNVPRNPPLFLSDAWVDYRRPVESRVKMLELTQAYRDEVAASGLENEVADVLSLTMRSLQTLREQLAPARASGRGVEVAHGRPYRLSSAYGSSSRTGVVRPDGDYFFHTAFGRSPAICVDLGRPVRVRRIEMTNRRNGYQERAKHVFAVLATEDRPAAPTQVFPVFIEGSLPQGAWNEAGVDLPDVVARFVTITTPLNTALHLADLRVYAAPDDQPPPAAPPLATRLRDGLARRARRVAAGGRRRIRRIVAGS